MNKKISTPIALGIILILSILVGSFTIFQYLDVQKENTKSLPEIKIPDKEKDEITLLLGEIEKENSLDFSEINNIKFDWAANLSENITVEGKGIKKDNILQEERTKIDSFLRSEGFEIDSLNSGDGTLVGSMAYKRENIVCLWYVNQKETDYFACGKIEKEKSYIKVISPNGEEEWRIGNTYTIKWDSGGVEKIDIGYKKEGSGADINGWIAKEIDAFPGEYSWEIPSNFLLPENNKGWFYIIVSEHPFVAGGGIVDDDNYFIVVKEEVSKCSDGTLYGQCSANKPQYCDKGNLVDKSSLCGCPANYEVSGNQCVIKVSCQNECSQAGSAVCSSVNSYQTCGNYDADNCLEWGSAVSCSEKKCIMGNCLSQPLLNPDVEYWSILLSTGLQKDDPSIDINSNQTVKNILLRNGWEESHIKTLTGPEATPANFDSAIGWLKNNSGPNDIIFIVLHAHGGSSGIAIEGGSIEYSKLNNDLNDIQYGGMAIVVEACGGSNALPILKKENREILWLSGGPALFWNGLAGFGDLEGNKNNWVSAEEIYHMGHLYDVTYPSQSESVIQDDFPGELNVLYLNNYWQYLDQYNTQPMIYGYGSNIGAMAEGVDAWVAQSFVPNFPILTKVALGWVVKHKSPGPLTLSIRENLSGSDLVSLTLPENVFLNETQKTLVDFDFPDLNVIPGKTYYIVLKASQAISRQGTGNVYSISGSKSATIKDDFYLKGKISLFNDMFPPSGFVYTDLAFYTFGKLK